MSTRIAIFKERLDPHSGFSKHILEVSRRLAARGYRFWIVTTRLRSPLPAAVLETDRIVVHAVGGHPYGYMRTRARAIRAAVADADPHLLDVHGGPGTVLTAARPRGLERPWVFSLHAGRFRRRDLQGLALADGWREPKLRSPALWLNLALSVEGLARALNARAPCAVAVPTRRLQRALRPRLECPVWHIPSGVDPALAERLPLPSAAKRALGLPPEEALLLFFGKAQLLRGLDTLLEAFARLAAVRPRARLLLVLRPDAASRRVETWIARHPARERIHRIHRTLDPMPYLAAADAVVLPFRSGLVLPAQPLTLLEAMACGKPVVSTTIPPVREVITSGEEGWLVPPGDADRLADRLLWVLDRPEEAARMGERARRRVLRDYTWDAIAQRTDAFYRQALREEGGP